MHPAWHVLLVMALCLPHDTWASPDGRLPATGGEVSRLTAVTARPDGPQTGASPASARLAERSGASHAGHEHRNRTEVAAARREARGLLGRTSGIVRRTTPLSGFGRFGLPRITSATGAWIALMLATGLNLAVGMFILLIGHQAQVVNDSSQAKLTLAAAYLTDAQNILNSVSA